MTIQETAVHRLAALALAIPLLVLPAQLSAQGRKRLTFEQASGGRGGTVSFSAPSPAARWARDGLHVIVGSGRSAKLLHPVTGEERPASEADQQATRRAPSPRLGGRRRGGGRGPRIAVPGAALTAASPDGKAVSFVKEHDLWVFDHESNDSRRLTTGGSKDLLNGELDWVYQEEVYGRGNYRAHWWSPDSQRLAFLQLYEKEVPYFTIANPVPRAPGNPVQFQPKVTEQRYPKPGQPNPTVKLGVVPAAGGDVSWVDLSVFPDDCLVVRVGWTPDAKRVLFMVQDRIQSWLELCDADPATGDTRRLIRDSSPGWTARLPMPRWLADGTFLWESERSGYRHLYHYRPDGKLVRQITTGEWAVSSVEHVDEDRGWIWFTAWISTGTGASRSTRGPLSTRLRARS